jgi:hypothetical protein
LKNGKEEIEGLKREIEGYKQMFLKNAPTPHKSQSEVRATLVLQHHNFKCPQLLVTYVMHWAGGGTVGRGNAL